MSGWMYCNCCLWINGKISGIIEILISRKRKYVKFASLLKQAKPTVLCHLWDKLCSFFVLGLSGCSTKVSDRHLCLPLSNKIFFSCTVCPCSTSVGDFIPIHVYFVLAYFPSVLGISLILLKQASLSLRYSIFPCYPLSMSACSKFSFVVYCTVIKALFWPL